jgi:hypothetical protein
MKPIVVAVILLTVSALTCAQTGAVGAEGKPVGAYQPNPSDPNGDLAPADRPPVKVLKDDPKLVAKLQKLLPETITPQQACDGFKKLSDCVSALHAAQNLGIPLADLKGKIVADKSHDALEKAIHELKPDADAKAERKKAQKQADRDIPVSD